MASATTVGAMRLVTWNTLWRFGDWAPRQPLLASHLAALEPDVVLLQEAWPAQARELAAACGLEALGFSGGYFDRTISNVPVDAEFGNAILARSGEIVVDEAFAAAPGDAAPRRLLAARIDGRVVATSHLSHMNEAGEGRAEQLRWIARSLAGLEPYVFGGDCNLVPSSPEYAVAAEVGLRDLWAEAHPDEYGGTMVVGNPEIGSYEWMDDRNGEHAPPGSGVRLDYLWATEGVTCTSIELIGRGETGSTRWPSDHLGLLAELP